MDYRAEVERLTAGADETPRDPDCWPTPGQWIHMWNVSSPARRLEIAERAIQDAQDAAGPQTISRLLGIGTTVIYLQPDDVLLIGNVDGRADDLPAALGHLRELWPERRVVLFSGDIDVQAANAADLAGSSGGQTSDHPVARHTPTPGR